MQVRTGSNHRLSLGRTCRQFGSAMKARKSCSAAWSISRGRTRQVPRRPGPDRSGTTRHRRPARIASSRARSATIRVRRPPAPPSGRAGSLSKRGSSAASCDRGRSPPVRGGRARHRGRTARRRTDEPRSPPQRATTGRECGRAGSPGSSRPRSRRGEELGVAEHTARVARASTSSELDPVTPSRPRRCARPGRTSGSRRQLQRRGDRAGILHRIRGPGAIPERPRQDPAEHLELPQVVVEARGLLRGRSDVGAGPIGLGEAGGRLQDPVADLQGLRIPLQPVQAAGELPLDRGVPRPTIQTLPEVMGGLGRTAQARSRPPRRGNAPRTTRAGASARCW